MKKLLLTTIMLSSGVTAFGAISDITSFKIPYNNRLPGRSVDGKITINTRNFVSPSVDVTTDFYSVDTHGFSKLPAGKDVLPLKFGSVKLGGNLHSQYNWSLNAYYSNYSDKVEYVYAPLERRLRIIKNSYGVLPMLQVNMMGWHPDYDGYGNIVYANTADAVNASKLVALVNKKSRQGVKNFLMGNEPFHWKEVHGKDIPSADEYIAKYIDYALKMRAAQEKVSGNANDIKLWGPELATGWTGWQTTHPADCKTNYDIAEGMVCSYGNGKFKEFIPYFLDSLAKAEKNSAINPRGYKLLDVLTFHYYPLFRKNFNNINSILLDKNNRQYVPAMLEAVNVWDNPNYVNKYDSASPKGTKPQILQKFNSWVKGLYPGARISVTEFGIDSVEKIGYHPIIRPLYLAELMPRLAQAGVKTFVKSFLQAGAIGDSNSWALINGEEQSPMYNMYYLFSNNYLGKPLASNDTYNDWVNSYAVKTANGMNLFILNKDAKVHASQIELVSGEGNTRPVAQLKFPAWSLTVLKLPTTRNGQISVQQYGAHEMGIAVENYYSSDNEVNWQ